MEGQNWNSQTCFISKPMDICKSNATATLILSANLVEQYLKPPDNTLTVKFQISFTISSRSVINSTGEISLGANSDLEWCSFQALTDFETMLNDETTSDIILKATLGAEKKFHCHKNFLIDKFSKL